jgi:hypothetical protein
MVIKNKDGTDYKLSGPNPLMKEQNIENVPFLVHNFGQEEIVEKDKNIDIPVVLKPKEPVREIIQENPKIEPKIEPVKPKISINYTQFACAPVVMRKRKDDLYGETYSTVEYLDPIMFNGVVLDQSDFEFKFWAEQELTIGSILFPKTQEKRWWKIKAIQAEQKGWTYLCEISTQQLGFSF